MKDEDDGDEEPKNNSKAILKDLDITNNMGLVFILAGIIKIGLCGVETVDVLGGGVFEVRRDSFIEHELEYGFDNGVEDDAEVKADQDFESVGLVEDEVMVD